MCNVYDQLMKGFKSFSVCKPVTFLTSLVLWVCVLIVLGACVPTSQTGNPPTMSDDPELQNDMTLNAPSEEGTSEVRTPLLTPVMATQLTQVLNESSLTETPPTEIPEPILETEVISLTVAPTPLSEGQNVSGKLFVFDSTGIRQISLVDNTSEYLLTAQNDWLDWGARFAQNEKYLAYWIKADLSTELWVTSLLHWQPERVLEIDDVEYDFATPLWGVNDRYLLLDLAILDKSGPLEDVKTIRTYVIDMETRELVNQSYWPGNCAILATSPQTAKLALWCYMAEEETSLREFLVLESEGIPWTTQLSPESLTNNCLILATCAWSQDNRFVAFVATEHYPESLFYAEVSDPLPIQVNDKQTESYSFPGWSPDSQLLYYSGVCVDGTIQCPNVASVTDQEVVWRAKNNSNQGDFGIISVDHAVWSPDSLYLAMPVLGGANADEQILIISVMTQAEVLRLPNMGSKILDLVWLGDQ